MPGSYINAGFDAGPKQTRCSAGSVLGPDFGEILTSLVPNSVKRGRNLLSDHQRDLLLQRTPGTYLYVQKELSSHI